MANQEFYSGGNTGQNFPQYNYPSHQNPQYSAGSHQGGQYGGPYGGPNHPNQGQYGLAMQQNQFPSYQEQANQAGQAQQAQQFSYPAQQPMYADQQAQPYTSAQQNITGYDQRAGEIDGSQAGEGERGLVTHVVGAVGGRKAAKKMDLGPVAVLAAGFVGAKMLGSAKDKRDDRRRSRSRDNCHNDQYDDRYDDQHHHHSHRH